MEGTPVPVPAFTSGQNTEPPSNPDEGESEQEVQDNDTPMSTQGEDKGKYSNPLFRKLFGPVQAEPEHRVTLYIYP